MKQINHYSKNRQSDFYTALHSVTQRYNLVQRLILLTLLLLPTLMNAQTIANKVWEANGGTPADDLTYQKSTLDNSDNLIIVGNTYTTGQEENVWIVKYDPEGTLLWQYEYNYASNGRDYATNVVTGTNGDIFVTGSIFNAVSNTFDFLTLKLAANGTLLWTATHDANNFDDVAADIALDNNGNIYVTGGSQVSTTDWNYTTIKYNSSGTLLWSQQYDYANLRDVAVNIEVEGNNVIVTGASANTPQEWDYATVHYDDNGILQNTERTASGITGFDQPMDMVQDDNGFIYITGRGTQNGTNYDIQTVKLSSTLNVEWVVNFDGEGFEDGAADLELDAFKNVFIVGLTQNSNLTTDLLVVKYDELGNELWRRTRSSETGNAKATAAKVNPDGSIIVTGEVQNGTQIDFITLKYDVNGRLQWEQRYDSGTQEDRPQNVETDSEGNIYVTGTSDNGASSTYTTIKYETYERNLNTENSQTTGEPSHISNELIIRFRTDVVNTAFVNNRQLFYATLGEVITDVNAISALQSAIGAGEDFAEWTALKVYPNLTTDMTTTSRMGRTFVVPEIWTTFVLRIPDGFDPDFDEFAESDNLMALADLQKYIRYVEPNLVVSPMGVATDDFYNVQHSLHPTTVSQPNPNQFGHINVEGAWNIESGKPYVKVGVYDSGILWGHQDLNENTLQPGNGSKVKGGYNLDTYTTVNAGTPFSQTGDHGTPVAGIIGAMRNNFGFPSSSDINCTPPPPFGFGATRIGVAGIAGGNWCTNNGDTYAPIDLGVSLYDFRLDMEDDNTTAIEEITPADKIANGYVVGATSINSGGYGLHIANHSYGIEVTNSNFNNYENLLSDAIYFMYRNDVVNVAARGNSYGIDADMKVLPATVQDEWILSTGSNDRFGNRLSSSNIDLGIDLIAPGEGAMIKTLSKNGGYTSINATSAAAPHVSGVAGLLLSHQNNPNNNLNNLNHDDVENIVQLTAVDKFTTGYDVNTGWGLLDATAALQYIDQNHILHFPELGAGSSVTIVPTNTIFSFYQPNHLSSQGNNDFLVLQINEVTITYNHQSYVGSGNVINSWIRNSASEGYESTINVDDLEHKWCELLSANSQQAVTKTYLYKIVGYHAIGTSTANYIPNPTAQWDWWGVSPLGGNPICPYTLVVNGTITNNDEVVVNNENELKIYPIPTHNSVNIEFLLDETTDVMLDIFDLNGQLIKTVLTGQQIKGQHNISVSLDNIPTGIYLCRLQAGNKISTQKIVKIN